MEIKIETPELVSKLNELYNHKMWNGKSKDLILEMFEEEFSEEIILLFVKKHLKEMDECYSKLEKFK